MSGRVQRSRYQPLEFITLPKQQLTDAANPQVVKRVKKSTPFEQAFEDYLEGKCGSDYEDRTCKMESALESFSKIANSSGLDRFQAQYFQVLCQIDIAENQFLIQGQFEGLEMTLKLVKNIQNSHPFFLEARYWEGYCRCKFAIKSQINERFPFEKALACFNKIEAADHLYFEDASYWKGYCLFKLAKFETNSNIKFTKLCDAKVQFSHVNEQNIYYRDAKLLLLQCDFELTQLS